MPKIPGWKKVGDDRWLQERTDRQVSVQPSPVEQGRYHAYTATPQQQVWSYVKTDEPLSKGDARELAIELMRRNP